VLAAQQRPDHATIARFVERHQEAVAELFGEVLVLCARSGLVTVGVIAVDGTKLHANACRDENLDYEQIASPARSSKRPRPSTPLRMSFTARPAATNCPSNCAPARDGARGCAKPSVSSRLSARRRRGRSRAAARSGSRKPSGAWKKSFWTEVRANAAYERYRSGRMRDGRRFSRPPDPYTPPATPEGRINVSDPDSRVVKGLRGFIQGYNAQAVTNEHQIVVAAEVMTAAPDFGHLEPMLNAAQRKLEIAGVTERPEVLLADAGYWHQQQMEHIIDRGIQVLIPPDASKRKGACRGWAGGYYAFIRRVLASERGGELYRRRQPMIEPVFGQTKHNRGMARLHRRGRAAVRAEWRLITATHNLKLHSHALATA
jgi:hypothetical protein